MLVLHALCSPIVVWALSSACKNDRVDFKDCMFFLPSIGTEKIRLIQTQIPKVLGKSSEWKNLGIHGFI